MSPLANQDPLAQLNDIIAPTAPNWFPPAPIYWLLLLLCSVAIYAVYWLLKKRQQQAIKVKAQLTSLAQLQKKGANFIELNQLLKGCSLSYFSRNEVASLHGEQWFDFLQQYSDSAIFGDQKDFTKRLYQVDIQAVDKNDFEAAKKWITGLPKQIKKQNKKQEIKDV